MSSSNKLTHFDATGRAQMVDVSQKPVSKRTAIASGSVTFSPESFSAIASGTSAKGDIASIAEIAGIMGAKKTSDLIPLCHPLPITSVNVEIAPNAENLCFDVKAIVQTDGKTGVEMEALSAVSVACLTIYDMTKAIDKSVVIGPIRLEEKIGGVSGHYSREEKS